jgi:hypothetical protein
MKSHFQLFAFCLLFLFASCKKGYEERIATYVGTYKFEGNYFYERKTGGNQYNAKCTSNHFIIEIKKDNTFISYDTLNNKILSGSIKSYKSKPNSFHIKSGNKKGDYNFSLSENFPYCNCKGGIQYLYCYVSWDSEGHSPKNNLFFDGNNSGAEYTVFSKIK